MNPPCISIIIPIYNVEKYLRKCVDTCLSQTLTNIEIILVDDGSPDGCGAICDEYEKKVNRIKVIHKTNAGVGYARNSGLDIASGEYVYFVDPDDYIEANACETLYNAAKEESVDICFASFCHVKDGKVLDKKISPFSGKTIYPPETIDTVFKLMLGRDPSKETKEKFQSGSACQGIYRSAFLKENNLSFSNLKYGEDQIFNLKAIPFAQSVKCIPDFLYNYTSNPYSVSHTACEQKLKGDEEVFFKQKAIISEYTDESEMLVRAQTRCLGSARMCLKIAAKEKRGVALGEIRKIVNDETLQEILSDYPKDVEIIPRITNYFLKRRNVYVLYFLSLLASKRNRF